MIKKAKDTNIKIFILTPFSVKRKNILEFKNANQIRINKTKGEVCTVKYVYFFQFFC